MTSFTPSAETEVAKATVLKPTAFVGVPEPTAFILLLGDGEWSTDKPWEDQSSVQKMLDSSIKPATAVKYGRIWDKWVTLAALQDVEVTPPEFRGLEIFISNVAEFSESAGVATTAAAAVPHFCALEGIESPFGFPRFGKIL
jgi:hypothetical protein